jgi:hypothetical protein
MWSKIGLAVMSSVLSAALIDIRTYKKARETDKSATFDWCLFGTRLVEGAITGVLVGAGFGVVSEG